MEQKILHSVNYLVPRPTRAYFLSRFLLVSRVDSLDFEMRKRSPSPSSVTLGHSILPSGDEIDPIISFPSPLPHRMNSFSSPQTDDGDEISRSHSLPISLHSSPYANPSLVRHVSLSPREQHFSPRIHFSLPLIDEIDATSIESASVLSPSLYYQSRHSSLPYTESNQTLFPPLSAPHHGYVASSDRFKREESFCTMLLYMTLQVPTSFSPLTRLGLYL
jgi:hypothetical protein